jgi:hypothetical protein
VVIPKEKLTIAEIIKSRGQDAEGGRKNVNFNDLIDDRYDYERKEIKANLNQLDHLIRTEPKVFEFSFKRSLQNHILERKQLEEQELENQLRKQQQKEREERSERLKKLRELEIRYNIKVKTKVNEKGEEVIVQEIPYNQKVINECNDYNYFFTYKTNRVNELKNEKDDSEKGWQTGTAQRMLDRLQVDAAKRTERMNKHKAWQKRRREDEEDMMRQGLIKRRGTTKGAVGYSSPKGKSRLAASVEGSPAGKSGQSPGGSPHSIDLDAVMDINSFMPTPAVPIEGDANLSEFRPGTTVMEAKTNAAPMRKTADTRLVSRDRLSN